jgi:hypothetical protein
MRAPCAATQAPPQLAARRAAARAPLAAAPPPRRRRAAAARGARAAATLNPSTPPPSPQTSPLAPPPPPLARGILPWTPAQLAASQRGLGPPLGAYDPAELSAEFRNRPLLVASRIAAIATTLGAVGAATALDYATGALPRTQKVRAVELRKALTALGPTFIKLGQALSTRPDLLPAAFLEELQDLQDALPGFPDSQAFALIEAELGAPLERVYSRISPRPIAAASLGQVYRATLASTGELVAVKVQRPGTADAMRLDFFVVRAGAVLIDAAVASLHTSLTAAVDAFVAKVFAELDYIQEGRNCERFAALYGDAEDVLVPGVIWPACSARVLTMQWVEGTKLSDGAALAAQGLDTIKLVNVGIRCSLRQLLEAGFFHAVRAPFASLLCAHAILSFSLAHAPRTVPACFRTRTLAICWAPPTAASPSSTSVRTLPCTRAIHAPHARIILIIFTPTPPQA